MAAEPRLVISEPKQTIKLISISHRYLTQPEKADVEQEKDAANP